MSAATKKIDDFVFDPVKDRKKEADLAHVVDAELPPAVQLAKVPNRQKKRLITPPIRRAASCTRVSSCCWAWRSRRARYGSWRSLHREITNPPTHTPKKKQC